MVTTNESKHFGCHSIANLAGRLAGPNAGRLVAHLTMLSLFVLVVSCSRPGELDSTATAFNRVELALRLPAQGPYDWEYVSSQDRYELDDRGLPMSVYEGVEEFQPTVLAQFGLVNLNSWRLTGNHNYLDAAIRSGTELLLKGERPIRGMLWEPYQFSFPLHGDVSNTIEGPWYSALAQGQVLSLFVKLYRSTGEEGWRIAARQVFHTFQDIRPESALGPLPWANFVDTDGYLWLEEYAGNVAPMKVLNGHIFAMLGLYDWWALTHDPEAERLLEGAAATVLRYTPELRTPGKPSWYGYRIRNNPVAQSESYHYIHIWELQQLATLTGDERFTELATALLSDFGDPSQLKTSFFDRREETP